LPALTDEKNTNDTKQLASRGTAGIITGIAIHFGAVGSDNFVIVIPLPNVGSNSAQIQGIATFNLTDGSLIMRVSIPVPSLLCPSSSGTTTSACLTLTYQAYSVVDYNQITSFLSVDANVACSDVCSLSSSSCSLSCTTCDGQQVAGADTPVSRRFTMSSTAGTFLFDYQTYTIKDRITVWNAGKLIFDTGCVGANGTVSVSYSSSSSSVRVDVEPNCACTDPAGCVGTLWYFTAYCLNATHTRQAVISQSQRVQLPEINARTVNTVEGVLSLSDKEYIESGFLVKPKQN
jgi:hypothetical protein